MFIFLLNTIIANIMGMVPIPNINMNKKPCVADSVTVAPARAV
jgi:hypothetical protein